MKKLGTLLIKATSGQSAASQPYILCKANDERAPFSYVYALALFHPTSHIDMRTGREPRDDIRQSSHLEEERGAALCLKGLTQSHTVSQWG